MDVRGRRALQRCRETSTRGRPSKYGKRKAESNTDLLLMSRELTRIRMEVVKGANILPEGGELLDEPDPRRKQSRIPGGP
jgi:hypothetical protein